MPPLLFCKVATNTAPLLAQCRIYSLSALRIIVGLCFGAEAHMGASAHVINLLNYAKCAAISHSVTITV
jgi:hypothetical protein